VAGSYSYWLC